MKLVNLDPNPDFGTLIDLASTEYGLSKSRFLNRYRGAEVCARRRNGSSVEGLIMHQELT